MGALVGGLVLDTGMTPREVEGMTWWDLRDLNEARRRRIEAAAPPKTRATPSSLAMFGVAPPAQG